MCHKLTDCCDEKGAWRLWVVVYGEEGVAGGGGMWLDNHTQFVYDQEQ